MLSLHDGFHLDVTEELLPVAQLEIEATRAVRLLARFGFEELGLGRIEIVAAVGNKASQRVAEKAGAHREGVLRRRLCLHDEYHDAVMYSLIPDDPYE